MRPQTFYSNKSEDHVTILLMNEPVIYNINKSLTSDTSTMCNQIKPFTDVLIDNNGIHLNI